MKILVLNGPNLNLLGKREPEVYGKRTIDDINADLEKKAKQLGVSLEFYQSNSEGGIIDALHKARENQNAVILNAGGYTHTSVAIRDAISAIEIPVVEVHISNVHAREDFRHTSLISAVCKGVICGFGENSYALALQALADMQ
ncbi:MAG: type II 3-dehydroquinate dehydratase [Oscillospiraceae bacterium]